MDKSDLNKNEIEKAKQNGFILTGRVGSGKTTLLNVIFGKEVCIVKRNLSRVTEKSSVYYCRLENGNCISIIDTPGLSYRNKMEEEEMDTIYLKEILKVISEQKINIKGILFLVNFQNERFDAADQETLLKYHSVFPFKRFWINLIVIFTHHYADPDGDDQEEMKEIRDRNGEIFSRIMDKVKNVSYAIDYRNLKIRYYNCFWPVKNDKQRLTNMKNRDDLEILLDELCKRESLFSKKEISPTELNFNANNDNKILDNNKIKNSNSNNISLEKQNEEFKDKINKLEKYIKELESKLNDKDIIINELKSKNENLNKKIKDLENNSNINSNPNNIIELQNEIQLFKSYCNFSNDEKLIKINFISSNQDIDYSTITKNTEKFSKLEIPLYEKYPNYLDSENYFLVNGKRVNRNRTLEENRIKNGDVITLLINNFDE